MHLSELVFILHTVTHVEDIIRNIIPFAYIKPITLEIMKSKIKKDEFDNMNDGYGSIEQWDTSQITDMSNLFLNKFNFNRDISNWDVSNVTDMTKMFYCCYNFNQNLDNWNTSNVEYMNSMFKSCDNFNQSLNNWDFSKVNLPLNLYN